MCSKSWKVSFWRAVENQWKEKNFVEIINDYDML